LFCFDPKQTMADGRQGGAAGAASPTDAVILSKTSGLRRPQLSNSRKDLKRNYVFYLQYIAMIVSYVAALLKSQCVLAGMTAREYQHQTHWFTVPRERTAHSIPQCSE
jgi:hypothetical protein